MDAEYLQETIGSSLAKGLAEVSSIRPADPIEYLAAWLLKHKDNVNQRQNNPVRFCVDLSACQNEASLNTD